ncbi:metalloregulator ArsR/SmtB family transcription factor [soil metagenome]
MPRKTKRPDISPRGLQLVADRFKVLSEPARLRILMVLEDGEQNVTALVSLTGLTQANVSKHLALLMTAGMVDRRKEGVSSYYFIADPQIFDLCDLMCHRIEASLASSAAPLR